MSKEFYDYSARTIGGKEIKMNTYKGKTVLVVNTASECGLTPQYEGLENLYQKYKDRGLVILGFPCNQFGGQEPGTEEEIQQGCLLNYGVSFPMFAKVHVNGPKTHPLFSYLKSSCKGLLGKSIKWNFTKFLIDSKGQPIERYAPTTLPENIARDIEEVLPEHVA